MQKEQEREMVNTLQQQQSEWIDSITSRIQQHQEIVDNNCKAMEQKAERRENGYRQALEHQIGALSANVNAMSSKMDEMDKKWNGTHSKWNAVHQMDAVNRGQLQELLDQQSKSMAQRQEMTLNQLKQDTKREIYGIQTELDSAIKKSKNEMESSIAQIAQNMSALSNDIKYQLMTAANNGKGSGSGKGGGDERSGQNVDSVDALRTLNHQQSMALEQYQRSIQSQTDSIKQSLSTLRNVEDTVSSLSKESRNLMEFMQQQTGKLMQIGDDNAEKMERQITGLQPLFTKLYRHFEDNHNNLVGTVNQNKNDIISSFTQYKNVEYLCLILFLFLSFLLSFCLYLS